jgi:hypothetical protein
MKLVNLTFLPVRKWCIPEILFFPVMAGWWSERWIVIRNEYHLMIEVRKLTAMYHAVTQSLYCLRILYLLTWLITPCMYDPLRALASLIMDACSFLLTALCRHLLTFIFHRSFSLSSSHLNLSLPLPLLSSLLSNILLTVLRWSVLTICQIRSNFFFSISSAMSRYLYSSLKSWLVNILLFWKVFHLVLKWNSCISHTDGMGVRVWVMV